METSEHPVFNVLFNLEWVGWMNGALPDRRVTAFAKGWDSPDKSFHKTVSSGEERKSDGKQIKGAKR